MSSGSVLVTVVLPGADASMPRLWAGNASVPARLIGHDSVSRLCFLQAGAQAIPAMEWLGEAGSSLGGPLQAITAQGPVKCRADGWVKQIGGKVLPLALVRLQFDKSVPLPGTAVVDGRGRVAAVMFQASGAGSGGYAIPAEAVHRVCRDVCNGGRLVRGWLGLTLRAESKTPQIVRVLPESPAAAAGIRQGDVLLAVGPRRISDYADAANAFFYLVPGRPVPLNLQRGGQQLEITVIPSRAVGQ